MNGGHIVYICGCGDTDCPFCGNPPTLTICEVCGGDEAFSTTECPRVRIDLTAERLVRLGLLDFRDRLWWKRATRKASWEIDPNRHSSGRLK